MYSEFMVMLQYNVQVVFMIFEGVNIQCLLFQWGIWLLFGMVNVIIKWVLLKIEEIIIVVMVLWYVCFWMVKFIEEQGFICLQYYYIEDI